MEKHLKEDLYSFSMEAITNYHKTTQICPPRLETRSLKAVLLEVAAFLGS